MSYPYGKVIFLLFLVSLVSSPSFAHDQKVLGASIDQYSQNLIPRFASGEQLSYRISVWGIPAGNATLEVVKYQPSPAVSTLQLRSLAKSNKIISLFFPVHNQVRSVIDSHSLMPIHFIFHRREGTRHEDFDVTFHRDRDAVTVIKDGKRSVKDLSLIHI